ncbi:MAG: XrtA/PEP-CTERM system exopolysaccharide export protein [Alphaproteobacteria bacterium]
MTGNTKTRRLWGAGFVVALMIMTAGCVKYEPLPTAAIVSESEAPDYIIGALDSLTIFVWRNPEVSTSVAVRPDGRISVPLIEDLDAAGRTPTELAREIESKLSVYIQDPMVTVIVGGFSGSFDQQVRVIGEAAAPQAIPYRANMTLLDVMISVGGITDFAAGNRASIVRVVDDQQKQFGVRLDDLVKNGDISANVQILPGDVLIIPESWF